MPDARDDDRTLSRLLRLKKALGLSESRPARLVSADEAGKQAPLRCVNCNYDLGGQPIDRCPECGLVLASCYRDLTPWALQRPRPLGWLATAKAVWTFNRFIRVRTSLVPTTPETTTFALWSILATAILAGAAMAVHRAAEAEAMPMLAALFVAAFLAGSVVTGAFLAATLYATAIALTGRWRRFEFVPASVHYASAWWPPIALAVLLLAWIHAAVRPADMPAFVAAVSLGGVILWSGWLASSITESGRVRRAAGRVVAVGLAFAIGGATLLWAAEWSVRTGMTQAFAAADAGLRSVRLFGSFGAERLTKEPRTYALVIDAIPSDDEPLILERLTQMGAGPSNRVIVRGLDCTLATAKRAFRAAAEQVEAGDRFILYINGHGARHGAGSIRIADGEITSQNISDFLESLRTPDRLVVIDSCFGGTFLRSLQSCDAMVLAATDKDNVAFTSGLRAFWEALGAADADRNGDGKITVPEAFWGAYREMLAAAEEKRQTLLRRPDNDEEVISILSDEGYATPQLDTFGRTDENVFTIEARREQ